MEKFHVMSFDHQDIVGQSLMRILDSENMIALERATHTESAYRVSNANAQPQQILQRREAVLSARLLCCCTVYLQALCDDTHQDLACVHSLQ